MLLSICSKQAELEKKQDKLTKLEKNLGGKTLDNSTNEINSNNTDYFPFIMLGGIAVLIVGVVIGLLVSKKNQKLCEKKKS